MRTRTLSTLLALLVLNAATHAQSTAFTYQGRLKNGASAASGLHDFRFRLFDAATGGTQLGTTQCINNVAVTDGLFTTAIDFGHQYATPSPRFLEILVRVDIGQTCADETGYVTLVPRQALTATPLANHAKSAFSLAAPDGSPASAVVVDNDGNVGIGTSVPTARLDVVGGSTVLQNSGDQAEVLWLATERSWVFRQEGTGAAAALKLQSMGGGGNKNFIVQTDGFMGIGTTIPLAKLDVRGDIRLGPSGQFLAPAAEENLRLLRGTIQILGTVFAGSGWTVTHPSTGTYVVTFNTPFSAMPSITASAGVAGFSVTQTATTNGVTFVTRNPSGVNADSSVFFIAAGPR